MPYIAPIFLDPTRVELIKKETLQLRPVLHATLYSLVASYAVICQCHVSVVTLYPTLIL